VGVERNDGRFAAGDHNEMHSVFECKFGDAAFQVAKVL
jgi:hypothetical protein